MYDTYFVHMSVVHWLAWERRRQELVQAEQKHRLGEARAQPEHVPVGGALLRRIVTAFARASGVLRGTDAGPSAPTPTVQT